jgi:hypothetical protein
MVGDRLLRQRGLRHSNASQPATREEDKLESAEPHVSSIRRGWVGAGLMRGRSRFFAEITLFSLILETCSGSLTPASL